VSNKLTYLTDWQVTELLVNMVDCLFVWDYYSDVK